VLKSLEREMNNAAKQQDFELAAYYRDGLQNLLYLLQPNRPIHNYLDNPNLRLEIRQEALRSLRVILNSQNISPPIDQLSRIECYDISTLSGKYSTGSLVVFTDGQPDKSQYRRFKIKKEGLPNDIAMMTEMLTRRFQRYSSPFQGEVRRGRKPDTQQHQRSLSLKVREGTRESYTNNSTTSKNNIAIKQYNNKTTWPLPDLIVLDGGLPSSPPPSKSSNKKISPSPPSPSPNASKKSTSR